MGQRQIAFLFIIASLFALIIGVFFGVIGGLQYILPRFLKENLPFAKIRPLHVTLVITWIFSGAIGGIYYYLPQIFGRLYSILLAKLHFVVFLLTGIAILISYFMGSFGGREYLEFPPMLALPMLLSWIFFLINFFMTIKRKLKRTPVYIWMWATGILFFFFTFLEAYLWTIPYFRDNIIRDITIQWKSMGSLVGSWNMLVYGTGFFLMEKITGNDRDSHSKLVFFFYFLGLTNLMFNWGHHTYIVPAAPWIKNVAYIISMTELLILGNIIRIWRKSIIESKRFYHLLPFRFLSVADLWIFLNLILAILISIPSINLYSHGTHITVAHAMGATIGINTMLLLASLFYIAKLENFDFNSSTSLRIKVGFWLTNASLFIFWISLIGSGIVKAIGKSKGTIFQDIMIQLSPWFHVFSIAGIGIFIGIVFITQPLVWQYLKRIKG